MRTRLAVRYRFRDASGRWWRYIDAHHEQWGVALFVVPPLVVFEAVAGVMWLITS
jgi:hypothetical protein